MLSLTVISAFTRTSRTICFYNICDFHRIRRHLSISTAKTISVAAINTQLDNRNSLPKTLPNKNVYNAWDLRPIVLTVIPIVVKAVAMYTEVTSNLVLFYTIVFLLNNIHTYLICYISHLSVGPLYHLFPNNCVCS